MEAKKRILAKSAELFLRFGIRSISMDDIANNLGMSKKTLYQYYADKDELVHAMITGHLSGMEQDCGRCGEQARDAIHELVLTIDQIMEEFTSINPIVIHDLEKFHFKAFQAFLDFKNRFLAGFITKNLEWGIREELYRPELNVEVLTKFRLESMMIPFNVSVFPPGKFSLAETSGVVIDHFLYGLVTVKGHKLIQKYNQQQEKTSAANH